MPFVATLYQNILGRPPEADNGGLDFWLNSIHSGSSRADVTFGISESPEHQTKLAPSIDNGIVFLDHLFL